MRNGLRLRLNGEPKSAILLPHCGTRTSQDQKARHWRNVWRFRYGPVNRGLSGNHLMTIARKLSRPGGPGPGQAWQRSGLSSIPSGKDPLCIGQFGTYRHGNILPRPRRLGGPTKASRGVCAIQVPKGVL
jgi:hypothetical protein